MPSDLFSFSVIILAVYRSVCLRVGDAQSPPSVGVWFPCRELALVSGSRAASDKP